MSSPLQQNPISNQPIQNPQVESKESEKRKNERNQPQPPTVSDIASNILFVGCDGKTNTSPQIGSKESSLQEPLKIIVPKEEVIEVLEETQNAYSEFFSNISKSMPYNSESLNLIETIIELRKAQIKDIIDDLKNSDRSISHNEYSTLFGNIQEIDNKLFSVLQEQPSLSTLEEIFKYFPIDLNSLNDEDLQKWNDFFSQVKVVNDVKGLKNRLGENSIQPLNVNVVASNVLSPPLKDSKLGTLEGAFNQTVSSKVESKPVSKDKIIDTLNENSKAIVALSSKISETKECKVAKYITDIRSCQIFQSLQQYATSSEQTFSQKEYSQLVDRLDVDRKIISALENPQSAEDLLQNEVNKMDVMYKDLVNKANLNVASKKPLGRMDFEQLGKTMNVLANLDTSKWQEEPIRLLKQFNIQMSVVNTLAVAIQQTNNM